MTRVQSSPLRVFGTYIVSYQKKAKPIAMGKESFEIDEPKNTNSESKCDIKYLIVGFVIFAVVALAFGLGIGLGLKEEEEITTVSSTISTSTQLTTEPPIDIKDRLDCLSEGDVTKAECEVRGCIWEPVTSGPYCYFPANTGFKVKNQEDTEKGVRIFLTFPDRSRFYSDTVRDLVFELEEIDDSILRFKVKQLHHSSVLR